MMEQLKPCPFCGDKPYTQVRTNADKVVLKIGCGNCGVFLTEMTLSGTNFTQFNKVRSELIAKWNRRAKNEEDTDTV